MRRYTHLRHVLLLVALIMISSPAKGAVDYDGLIAQANQAVKSGAFVEALDNAVRAIRLDDHRFEGYYYAAFAFYQRGMTADAEQYAKGALERTSPEYRPNVDLLIAAIRGKGQFENKLHAGEEAESKNFVQKAAVNYEEAWTLVPARSDIGLRAAKLYGQLGQRTRGARILRDIARAGHNPDVDAEALRVLSTWKASLDKDYTRNRADGDKFYDPRRHLTRGSAVSKEFAKAAIDAYRNAIDAAPQESRGLHLAIAEMLSEDSKVAEAVAILEQGIALQLVTEQEIRKSPLFNELSAQPEFRRLMDSAYGSRWIR